MAAPVDVQALGLIAGGYIAFAARSLKYKLPVGANHTSPRGLKPLR